ASTMPDIAIAASFALNLKSKKNQRCSSERSGSAPPWNLRGIYGARVENGRLRSLFAIPVGYSDTRLSMKGNKVVSEIKPAKFRTPRTDGDLTADALGRRS